MGIRALLDTHAFLWGIADESKLSAKVRTLLPSIETWFSAAGLWEIVIKSKAGRLPLPSPVGPYVKAKLAFNQVKVLPITLDHVLRLENLELHHRDPFDRILIAQSIEEKLPIITSDPWFARYPVEVIW